MDNSEKELVETLNSERDIFQLKMSLLGTDGSREQRNPAYSNAIDEQALNRVLHGRGFDKTPRRYRHPAPLGRVGLRSLLSTHR
jgi:hypothetical protein